MTSNSVAGHDPLVGRVVGGRFRVVQLLGEGGMGRVYLADQPQLQRSVALKLLRPERVARGGPHRERFLREARAASRINHPGLATVYDFGEWEDTLYLAMELLRGPSLAKLLELQRRLPGAEAARILIQVCEVLEAMHRLGILHRDIKPENIMLVRGQDGAQQAKVVDFGLSLLLSGDDARLTREGLVSGTPAYMSPEQCRGRRAQIDTRSDLYSLGVVLYELLCGQVPFEAETPTETLLLHLFQQPVRPSERLPGVALDPALEALALWALSKEPAARPATAEIVRRELQAALGRMEGEPEPPRTETGQAAGSPAATPVPTFRVTVLEPAGRPFSRTLTALLRANGFDVQPARSLAEALREPGLLPLVLDLGPSPAAALEQVTTILAGSPPARPVVAVGPGEAIQQMSRALELGLRDYVAAGEVVPRLLSVLRRLEKRWQKG